MDRAFMLAIIAGITGGAVPVFSKLVLGVFSPFTLNTIRMFFATLFLPPFALLSGELSWKNFRSMFWVSCFGALNPLLLFIALQYTKASTAPLIYASVPIMAAIYSSRNGHRFSKIQSLGIVIGFFGVGTIMILPLFEKAMTLSSLGGNLLIFMSAISFFVYSELSRRKQKNESISPLHITFYYCLISFFLMFPIGAISFLKNTDIHLIKIWHIAVATSIGIVGTGIFYLAYQKALQIGSTFSASLFIYLQPIATTILAVMILGEKLTPLFYIGALLAVVGVHMASKRNV